VRDSAQSESENFGCTEPTDLKDLQRGDITKANTDKRVCIYK